MMRDTENWALLRRRYHLMAPPLLLLLAIGLHNAPVLAILAAVTLVALTAARFWPGPR